MNLLYIDAIEDGIKVRRAMGRIGGHTYCASFVPDDEYQQALLYHTMMGWAKSVDVPLTAEQAGYIVDRVTNRKVL